MGSRHEVHLAQQRVDINRLSGITVEIFAKFLHWQKVPVKMPVGKYYLPVRASGSAQDQDELSRSVGAEPDRAIG